MKKKIIFFLLLGIAGLVIYFFFLTTSVTKNIDTHVYDLPFSVGASYKVVQGYGGMFSHKYKAALDFSMPEGTPIHAARSGIIYSFKDNSNEGGLLSKYGKKANYIIIKHNDGSFGCYWHLKKDGVVVKKGFVAAGQLIGYSGSSGFVLQPHLHFAVKRRLNYEKDSFVRTKFKTSKGIQLLERGESYKKLK
jgi:murein DD-endopeptidase MepM/ murein hydrolase activator NlpD